MVDHHLLLFSGVLVSAVTLIFTAAFGLYQAPSRRPNQLFLLLAFLITALLAGWFAGFQVHDPLWAEWGLLSLLLLYPAAVVILHLLLIIFDCGVSSLRLYLLFPLYSASVAVTAYFIIFRENYLSGLVVAEEPSGFNEPEWGVYHWIIELGFNLFFIITLFLLLVALWRLWRNDSDLGHFYRLLYCTAAIILAWGGILTVIRLLSDVQLLISLLPWFGLPLVLFGYTVVSRDVLNPLDLLKEILRYLLGVATATLLFNGVVYLNNWVMDSFSAPGWIIPSIFSALAVFVLQIFWRRYKDSENIKYEFITIITHKFRTPLTRINWSLETLKIAQNEEEYETSINEIRYSAQKLLELTNVLVNLGRSDGISYNYEYKIANLVVIVQKVFQSVEHRISEKDISYEFNYDDAFTRVDVDKQRLIFALQILLENAISYTPAGGEIKVHIAQGLEWITFSIQDSGIGISREEMPYMFSKFYRTGRAKKMDPQGMGIGLYMTRQIVERHGGYITVDSPGSNKGTEFKVYLPRPRRVGV